MASFVHPYCPWNSSHHLSSFWHHLSIHNAHGIRAFIWVHFVIIGPELKWRLESHEHYGWTNDAKMNTNDDVSIMINMDGQMMPKWTQMTTWIPWAIGMDKLCQNELKWRLESHEQYGWTNDDKMNSNEELNIMSNMDGQMMPKWTQMKTNGNMDWQMMPKWTQMKTWIPWAIVMDKLCQNVLKWRFESHEQYGWTNDYKMNSNECSNPMSIMDGQMMPKWTQMTTWVSWAIWMDKWCQNELKWRLESHEQYWWTNDAKMNSNELKWRLEYHEQYGWTNDAKMNSNEDKWQYGWTNDAKMNSNEDLNPMSNMDGPMITKWTQMKARIPCALWMDKWCQNELKWRLEFHGQYGWTNDAKMNSN